MRHRDFTKGITGSMIACRLILHRAARLTLLIIGGLIAGLIFKGEGIAQPTSQSILVISEFALGGPFYPQCLPRCSPPSTRMLRIASRFIMKALV
jgi:hypothetical protein